MTRAEIAALTDAQLDGFIASMAGHEDHPLMERAKSVKRERQSRAMRNENMSYTLYRRDVAAFCAHSVNLSWIRNVAVPFHSVGYRRETFILPVRESE